MRLLSVVLFSLALGACAHGTTPNDLGSEALSGYVTGVIVLPDATANGASCTQIDVYATTTDSSGAVVRVGRPSIHQGNGRCSYQIANLPPGVALTVHVQPPTGMTCGNGASLAFTTQSADAFALKDDEGRTRDFNPRCSTSTSSL
jgi:hypothetical protein